MDELNDPQLESMLGRLSGAYPDANVAFVSMRGKVRQAKRRRAFAAGSAACALLIGVGVLAAQTGGSADRLQPTDNGGLFITIVSSQVSDTEVDVTETSTESSTESSTTPTESTIVDSTVDTTAAATTIVDAGNNGSPSSVSNSGHGNNNPTTTSSGTATTTPSTKPSTKPTVPTGQQTTSSKGGSLTFSRGGNRLTLVSVAPASGFHEDRGARVADSGQIRVEFSNGSTTWRIEVRLEGGKTPIETSKHG
jgi:hypothetical protein